MRRTDTSIRGVMSGVLLVVLLVIGLPTAAFGMGDDDEVVDAVETIPDHTIVYILWQRDPCTTLTVQWIDDSPESSPALRCRAEGGGAWVSVSGKTAPMPGLEGRYIHWAEATGLEPGTVYEVFPPTAEASRRVRTLSDDPEAPLRFVQTADIYLNREALIHMHGVASSKNPDFMMLGGDIAYSNGKIENAARWLDFLDLYDLHMVTPEGLSVPMIPAIGNHEALDGFGERRENIPFFFELFAFPGPSGYGVLDIGEHTSIVVLDSGHANRVDGPQLDWLRQTLKARRDRPRLFALYHVPAYPSVRRTHSHNSVMVRRNWTPLFERFGVDVCFEGHDHAYKRTLPIREGEVDPRGVIYMGDGGYAQKSPRVPAHPGDLGLLDESVWYLAKTRSGDHFILCETEGTDTRLFAVSSDGYVFDRYSFATDGLRPVTLTARSSWFARPELWIGVALVVGLGFEVRRRLRRRRRAVEMIARPVATVG